MRLEPGMIVSHFKRDYLSPSEQRTNKYIYKIIDIAKHTETGEMMLVYQALYYPFCTFVRPLNMALEKVDKDKYPDALQEYRLQAFKFNDEVTEV